MKKHPLMIMLTLACGAVFGAPDFAPADAPKVVCENGVCRLADAPLATAAGTEAGAGTEEPARMAQGYMPADRFIAFLDGDATASDSPSSRLLPSSFFLLPFFLILAGLALNLTPCVLPMIPVNLIIIGRSAKRGFAFLA